MPEGRLSLNFSPAPPPLMASLLVAVGLAAKTGGDGWMGRPPEGAVNQAEALAGFEAVGIGGLVAPRTAQWRRGRRWVETHLVRATRELFVLTHALSFTTGLR